MDWETESGHKFQGYYERISELFLAWKIKYDPSQILSVVGPQLLWPMSALPSASR